MSKVSPVRERVSRLRERYRQAGLVRVEVLVPKDKVNDIGIIVSVWLNPSVADIDNLDHKILFDIHRKATAQAIHKAMTFEPSIDWLLENQNKIVHKYFEKGLKGEI